MSNLSDVGTSEFPKTCSIFGGAQRPKSKQVPTAPLHQLLDQIATKFLMLIPRFLDRLSVTAKL